MQACPPLDSTPPGDDVLGLIGEGAVREAPDGELSRPIERVALERVRIVPAASLA